MQFHANVARLAALAVVFLAVGSVRAGDLSICDAYRTPAQQLQLRNCERIVSKGLVPNERALRYSLDYLNANRGSIVDPSCATADLRTNMPGQCNNAECASAGIQNGCSLIINDMKKPWTRFLQAGGGRTTGYFIDLCSEDPNKVVERFYINSGKSVDRTDSDQNPGVLPGAFKLDGELRGDFQPFNDEKYAGVRRQFGGQIPVIRMTGLNSSNNDSEWDRPLHVSPFLRSLGCPSVAPSSHGIMQRLAARGTSLMMNYDGPDYEQRGSSCVNEPGVVKPEDSGSRPLPASSRRQPPPRVNPPSGGGGGGTFIDRSAVH